MKSFLRSVLPLLLVAALGLAALPAHAGVAQHPAHDAHAVYEGGHCASHRDHGHANAAECLQVGHCVPLSPSAAGTAAKVAPGGMRLAPQDESASSAPAETSTPPPRSA
jgi:hypothetical protein